MKEDNGELLLEIRVRCEEALTVKGGSRDIVMIPFTGTASGPEFRGEILRGGVDTQKIGKDGSFLLSARYMLGGTDASGAACRIFIENQGNEQDGFVPAITTDSPLLRKWEETPLISTLEGIPGGVTVRIFRRETGE